VEEGMDVLGVDISDDVVQRRMNTGGRIVRVDVTNEDSLKEIGAFDINHAVVALGDNFHATVILVYMLKNRGVPFIHVQVNTELELKAVEALGATDVILPERDQAKALAKRIHSPSLDTLIDLGKNNAIVDVDLPADWQGKSLIELNLRKEYGVNVIAVKHPPNYRGLEHVTLTPKVDEPLEAKTTLYIAGPKTAVAKIKLRAAKEQEQEAEKVREETASC